MKIQRSDIQALNEARDKWRPFPEVITTPEKLYRFVRAIEHDPGDYEIVLAAAERYFSRDWAHEFMKLYNPGRREDV